MILRASALVIGVLLQGVPVIAQSPAADDPGLFSPVT